VFGGSVWLIRKTNKELREQGFVPWRKGVRWLMLLRQLPKQEQAIYNRLHRRQLLLLLSGFALFLITVLTLDALAELQ